MAYVRTMYICIRRGESGYMSLKRTAATSRGRRASEQTSNLLRIPDEFGLHRQYIANTSPYIVATYVCYNVYSKGNFGKLLVDVCLLVCFTSYPSLKRGFLLRISPSSTKCQEYTVFIAKQ